MKRKGLCTNKKEDKLGKFGVKLNYGINWSRVCALTCCNKELCPVREDHPSELPGGEFHKLIKFMLYKIAYKYTSQIQVLEQVQNAAYMHLIK